MSSALTGNKIKDSYQALLKMGTNGSLDPTTLITISDGLGNDTPLQLAGDKLATNYLGNDIGLRLDFANNSYYFGNYNNIGYSAFFLTFNNGTSTFAQTSSETNTFVLFGQSLNTWLGDYPGDFNPYNPAANSNNYAFGSDWYMLNNDDTRYPFKYNTVLNCYNNGLDTSDIAISYSLFANIQDPRFKLLHNISLLDDKSVSNCFIFGLNDFIGSSTLNIYETNGIPTNVVIINGSNLIFEENTSSIFSVNASSINFASTVNSGINIIGGDFAFKDNLFPADHILPDKDNFGITIQGRKAYSRNNFSYVKAEYFDDWGTQQGQVQVEELQLFNHWNDGSATKYLLDTIGNAGIFVQNSSTYTVEVKLISTTGNGIVGDTGNSYINKTWKVCVDSSGSMTITDFCIGCNNNPGSATDFEIESPDPNIISIPVTPDSGHGYECWVKAYVTLSCVTIN
jgi:hypothetical protein